MFICGLINSISVHVLNNNRYIHSCMPAYIHAYIHIDGYKLNDDDDNQEDICEC